MTKKYMTLIAAVIMSAAVPSHVYAKDDLQLKAEEILRSEPGANKVTIREEVGSEDRPNKKSINFMSFDLNGDGILARDEVGEKLFQIFDRDGNEVIDNKEMKRSSLLVFTPMKKKTVAIIDYSSSDTPQKTTVSEEDFLQKSQLAQFDKDEDGLSPLDFLGVSFNKVDVREDGVIDLYEFKRSYATSVKPKHEENFNYNE